MKVRRLIRKAGQHIPKAALERLYIDRKQGGRGLQNLEELYEEEVRSHYFSAY